MEKINLTPSKRLGQNFLINKGALRTIIEAADIKPDEVVLEIGPGTGILTLELARRAKKVIAVEKDSKMCEILRKLLANLDIKNVDIICGDILRFRISDFGFRIFKVVANIPYYLTSPVIRKFLENTGVQPRQMVLMVQKEVAQRICSKPPDMSILAVSVQFYAEAKIIDYVSKKSFWPIPKVDSAIIKIIPFKNIQRTGLCKLFFNVVKAGFSHPRKQLINNLSTGLSLPRPQAQIWLQKNKILPTARAETLTVEDWIKLAKSL